MPKSVSHVVKRPGRKHGDPEVEPEVVVVGRVGLLAHPDPAGSEDRIRVDEGVHARNGNAVDRDEDLIAYRLDGNLVGLAFANAWSVRATSGDLGSHAALHPVNENLIRVPVGTDSHVVVVAARLVETGQVVEL